MLNCRYKLLVYHYSLASYLKEHRLGSNLCVEKVNTLLDIYVRKGDEYPYQFFSTVNAEQFPLMEMLSEFYARSKEAVLVGEGAVPSGMKAKGVSVVLDELVGIAQRFTDLAFEL